MRRSTTQETPKDKVVWECSLRRYKRQLLSRISPRTGQAQAWDGVGRGEKGVDGQLGYML
jgi:hypothetical protein